jgi:hypothetical protein
MTSGPAFRAVSDEVAVFAFPAGVGFEFSVAAQDSEDVADVIFDSFKLVFSADDGNAFVGAEIIDGAEDGHGLEVAGGKELIDADGEVVFELLGGGEIASALIIYNFEQAIRTAVNAIEAAGKDEAGQGNAEGLLDEQSFGGSDFFSFVVVGEELLSEVEPDLLFFGRRVAGSDPGLLEIAEQGFHGLSGRAAGRVEILKGAVDAGAEAEIAAGVAGQPGDVGEVVLLCAREVGIQLSGAHPGSARCSG